MKEKKPNLYAVKIQVTSYAADTERYAKIKERSYVKLCPSLTEAFMSFLTDAVDQENHFFVDGYSSTISDSTCHLLSELHKELSNLSPVVIEDKELSLSIFHAAANGLMNYMRGSKQSRMDWFTTPDIVPE